MHSLFRRTFAAFVFSFAVLLIVLAGALVSGYHHSLARWSERRELMVEEAVRRVLAGESPADAGLPQDIPVFIYDREGTLVASNRGGGWRRETDQWERHVLHRGGSVAGHYEIGPTAFRNDAANRALTGSLTRTAAAGAVAALAVALFAAWRFARSLSRPAARVAAGIDSMAHEREMIPIPEQGAEEISRIARSANTLAARLQDERRLRAQWAQDVTHDLRTPVASIRAQLEAVADGVYSPDPKRILATLAELSRVETLIADLDELMRLEAPELRVRIAELSTHEFADTLRQRFEHELTRKRLSLTVDLRLDAIAADEVLLHRAVSNLLSNAIRHAPEAGRVSLSVGPSGVDRAEICVHNEGPPVPEAELPHLFDRLFRGEYARSSPGSGLGLTIARRITLIHGGTIEITSSESGGTTARILLPRRPV